MSGFQHAAECKAAEESCSQWMQPNPEGVRSYHPDSISASKWCSSTCVKACHQSCLHMRGETVRLSPRAVLEVWRKLKWLWQEIEGARTLQQ